MTRSSLDACWREQISDFEMALHQKESETTEAIKEAQAHDDSTIREAKAHQTTLIREAEALHATCIREAKANCASTIAEAEGCCSMAIRKVESHCAKQACSIQLSHPEGMQHLEMEAMEEEGKDCLSFPSACGTALQACPPEAHGVLMAPPPAHGEHASGHSPEHSPRYPPLNMNLPYWSLTVLPLWHPGPCSHPNGNTLPPARLFPCLKWKALLEGSMKSCPT